MILRISMFFSALAALFRSIWAKIRGFRVLCTDEETADRLEQCADCIFLQENQQCGVCGCYTPAKCALTMEKCPKNRWKPIWAKKLRQKRSRLDTI